MTQTIQHKRGDTFSYGGPVTFTGFSSSVTARCELRNPKTGNTLVAEVAVTLGPYVDDATPRALLLFADETKTAKWPIAQLNGDVQFTDADDFVLSTETFIVDVVLDITLPLTP